MGYNTFPITVGQKVWLSPKGNVARGWDGHTLREAVITKIARKYFYVAIEDKLYLEERFEKDSFYNECVGDCNAGYIIWESPEAFADYCQVIAELSAMKTHIANFERNARNCFSFNTELVHRLYKMMEEET